jgi:hypothetical protein
VGAVIKSNSVTHSSKRFTGHEIPKIGQQRRPPKYRRGVGNVFKVPPPKKGKFQPYLLVVGDGQHLRMANEDLQTE